MGLHDWTTADDLNVECIELLKQFATEESHPYEFAERYGNHGRIRAYQNRLSEAEELCRKSARLNSLAYGDGDMRTCLFRFYLAVVLFQSGKIEAAYQEHKKILQIREENLGVLHHDVGDSYYAVGMLKYTRGEIKFEVQI